MSNYILFFKAFLGLSVILAGVSAAPLHGFGHAVHATPVVAHAVHAPVVAHAVHAAPAYHAPVVAHAAPAYAAPDVVSPYTYSYAVADDYSKANFQAAESSDGAGTAEGSYSVALPDGRIQHVNYHVNDYDGYVADVTYDGQAQYAPAPVVAHAAPAYNAPVVAHAAPVVAHAVHAAPVVAHAVHAAPVVAHAVHAAPIVAHHAPVVAAHHGLALAHHG